MTTAQKVIGVLSVFLAVVVIKCGGAVAEDKPAPPPPAPVPVAAPTPPAKPKRTPIEAIADSMTPKEAAGIRAAVKEAQASGLFGEIDWPRGDIYVGALWADGDIQQKREAANGLEVVYVLENGKEGVLHFLDRKTGKRVARFFPESGLDID